jgi:DNA-directed RNA polymerase specialized sigma24 family protein
MIDIEYTNSEIAHCIDEHIHNALHRAMLKDRLIDGLTYEQIAELRDRSVRQTKTIIYRAEARLFAHLK